MPAVHCHVHHDMAMVHMMLHCCCPISEASACKGSWAGIPDNAEEDDHLRQWHALLLQLQELCSYLCSFFPGCVCINMGW